MTKKPRVGPQGVPRVQDEDLRRELKLRLRNLELPLDSVRAEALQLRDEVKRLGPDAPSDGLDERIRAFLAKRKKPKTKHASMISWSWDALRIRTGYPPNLLQLLLVECGRPMMIAAPTAAPPLATSTASSGARSRA